MGKRRCEGILCTKSLMYSVGNTNAFKLCLSIETPHLTKTVQNIHMLLDSGAASTFINRKLVDLYEIPEKSLKEGFQLRNADGTINPRGVTTTVTIHYVIKNKKSGERERQRMTFYVTDIHEDAILGMNWLKKFSPEVSWTKEKIRFRTNRTTNKVVRVHEIGEMAIN